MFSKQSTGNGTVLTPTNSGAVLVTGRYRFSEHSSIETQLFAHVKLTDLFFLAADLSHSGHHRGIFRSVRFQLPPEPKIEPFVFAGAGALVFYPGYSSNTINGVQTFLPASQQTQPAFLYGGGFDWRIFSSVPLIRRSSLTNHLALRLQYRGLVYKAPDFNVQNLFTGARGHMAEPSVGIVVKF